ncbi:hypothetical protein [Haloterrigena alkaliphila]|uniref:Uncharacterized protein n=1 Tax=Haloterrigena alkaliphila TaxID=2816475 RepID=A0A8A2VCQ0_9EURY|nr:hypothetical protein [Haloterrigena alkaliphila]QSW98182.1 hypothetical protein J0X25_12275 [Haloterrigena alkaliphila]
MSQSNASPTADDHGFHDGGGPLELPVELDATKIKNRFVNEPEYKIQGQIPVEQGSDLEVDLSALSSTSGWYVDPDAALYIQGTGYTQGTIDSYHVKIQQVATQRPRIVPIESAKVPVASMDIEKSLSDVGVSASIPGSAVVDLVDRYVTSATEVITQKLLNGRGGIVDLLTHADGTRVSIDVEKPYAGWQHDVQQIKNDHDLQALDPEDYEHVRAMVRPVLGATWGDSEYEARIEVPDPDLDRLYELADDESYEALTRV